MMPSQSLFLYKYLSANSTPKRLSTWPGQTEGIRHLSGMGVLKVCSNGGSKFGVVNKYHDRTYCMPPVHSIAPTRKVGNCSWVGTVTATAAAKFCCTIRFLCKHDF